VLSLSVLLFGCADEGAGAGAEAGGAPDAAADAVADSTADAEADASGPDATPAADAVADAGADAGTGDATTDVADATFASAPTDAAAEDTAPDAAPDAAPPPVYPKDDTLRLNHLQAKGTHNSYHIEPPDAEVPDWLYTHAPLDVQLEDQGVRLFELDVHWAPETGFTVHHVPFFDAVTTCETLADCLTTILAWSDENPGHHPIFVLVEPKDDIDQHKLPPRLDELDAEILSVWPRERILTPDDVRGAYPTLREAVLEKGWPTLGETRGKLVLTLLDHELSRDAYLDGHPTLEGRVMFADASPDDPWAGVLLMDDPVGDFDSIQAAVDAGFIVRTRSDTEKGELRSGNYAQKEAALASGAHLLSTDFPAPVEGVDYVLEIPGGTPSRCNPLVAPADCTSVDIEALP
jgi:hypothetical protein